MLQVEINLGLTDEVRDPFVSSHANWWALIIYNNKYPYYHF